MLVKLTPREAGEKVFHTSQEVGQRDNLSPYKATSFLYQRLMLLASTFFFDAYHHKYVF